MKPLFMIQSVLTMGFPTIMKAIYHEPFQNATQFSIQEDLWPLNKSSKGPAICSKRSQIITYDEAHYLVSSTSLTDQCIVLRFSDLLPRCSTLDVYVWNRSTDRTGPIRGRLLLKTHLCNTTDLYVWYCSTDRAGSIRGRHALTCPYSL